MPIRLSGMNSGLDTDAIVKALVSGYNLKKDKLTKSQTKLDWKRDAWKTLNTKVYGLYTNVSSLRFSSAYNLRKTTVSDQTKATVTASNTAVNGTQKLNIIHTAQAASMTGGKLAKNTKGTSTLAELGYVGADTSFDVVKKDGTVGGTVKITSSTTLDDVADQLKKAGLNANFDETNGRFFVSAKESGVDNDFDLMGADANATNALISMGLYSKLSDSSGAATDTGKEYAAYAAYKGADDTATETNIRNALTAYKNAEGVAKASETGISNLTAGMTYAKSYAAVQDFYGAHGEITNQDRFAAVVANYSSSSNAVVDASGKIYNATSVKDTDGNTILARKESDGTTTYVSQVVTYKNGDDIYTKNADGKYVKQGAAEGDEDYYYGGNTADLQEQVAYYTTTESVTYSIEGKDGDITEPASREVDDGNGGTKTQYYMTVDGKTYVSDSKTGTFKNEEDEADTVTVKDSYSYSNSGAEASGLQRVTDAYKEYKNSIVAAGMTEESADSDLATFGSNLRTVNSFEAAATDGGDYSKHEIVEQVQGAADARTLVTGYAENIQNLKIQQSEAEETMEENSIVSSLAGIKEPAKLNDAVTNMVGKVNAAAAAISSDSTVKDTQAAIKVSGTDAEIKLNGVTFTSSSNSFSINGLTINAMAETGDGDENAIQITTATDVQGIYDKIKDFLTEYNNVINEITKLYSAPSAKDYEPLTDEEKEEMTDKEIEKWEQKIKDSILRSDSTLSGVQMAMTSAMSKAIEIDGKKYSLVNFGIHTLGYMNSAENEQYSYHIDGDEDDANTSGNKDALMKAISEDPDKMMSFFQQLSTGLYEAVGNKMKMTTLSSSYTIYNDKQMDKEYKDYTKLIKEWEAKISAKEEYYYKKFTAMEKAMASLNSTQNSLGSYFQ